MSPTVQFDPATLVIWTTTGQLPMPQATLAAEAMSAAVRGEDLSKVLGDLPQNESLRYRMLWLASSVWHEKRHFLDTCLTNYGARRFRDLFNLACNFDPLLAHAHSRGEPICFPVEVYGDEVHRRRLGIAVPPPNILESARLAKKIKSFIADLDAVQNIGGKALYIGGEAQLEGLAQVSQLHAIEYSFGSQDLLGVTTQHVHQLPREGPYRTIEAVSGALGCAMEGRGGAVIINPGLASALFVTALCGRFYGAGPQPPGHLFAPWPRLARLIDKLGPKPGRFNMSDEEAAELVDKASRELYGRTALEEIKADIDAMEAKVTHDSAPWIAEGGLSDVFADFISLRRRLLAAALDMGLAGLLPSAFPSLWRDRLLPWHVVATPGGTSEESDGCIVFGRKLNVPAGLEASVPSLVTWGRRYATSATSADKSFALRADTAWLQMLERHGPRALLMLNGRRHRRMVPPELDRPIEEIEKGWGIPVRFHRYFEWPEQRDKKACIAEAVSLAAWSGRKNFVCDITGDTIEPTAAAVLTPWEFRRSPLLERFRNGGIVSEVRLVTDWSDWIVRQDLLD